MSKRRKGRAAQAIANRANMLQRQEAVRKAAPAIAVAESLSDLLVSKARDYGGGGGIIPGANISGKTTRPAQTFNLFDYYQKAASSPGDKAERQEWLEAQALAQSRYERLLKDVVTTFYLPPVVDPAESFPVVSDDSPEGEVLRNQMLSIPFPCVRIIRELKQTGDTKWPRIETDVICMMTYVIPDDKPEEASSAFLWAAKDTGVAQDGTRVPLYSPYDRSTYMRNVPQSYIDLMLIIADRTHRYDRVPVSRQVRRRQGFSPFYQEFIVLRKAEAKGHPTAMRIGDIFRRHPMLHAVRGHIRKLRSGRVTTVRPHARGKGTMLQVKNYIAEEEYVRS